MKKIYIVLAVLATALLSSCVQEKSFKDIVVGENELAFIMGSASTRSSEAGVPQVVRGLNIPLGTIEGEALFLEETIQELNPSPATRGIPVYNENLGILHKTLGVYAAGNFGDEVFVGMDESIHNGGWRYHHNYDGSPWPNETDTVDFYLRLPATPEGVTFTKRENKVTEFTLESSLEGAKQQDMVFGQVSITKKMHDDALPGGYPVEMKHALTGIKFANGHPNDTKTKTIITRVEIIGLYGKGDCSIDKNGNIEWSNTSSASTANAPFYLEFDNPTYTGTVSENDPDGTVGTTGDKTWDSSFNGTTWTSAAQNHNLNEPDGSLTFWFIPQEISNNVILKVYFTVKTPDSVEGFVSDACHTINLGEMLNEKYQSVEGNAGKNLKWETGQLRTYTLKPYDVDVDIKDVMADNNMRKEQLHIANTGNVDEYVRMLIMGNWYGWKPRQSHSEEPSILIGYKYSGPTDPNLPEGADPNEMVDPWYREGYDGDDPYGTFDNSFLLANLGTRDGDPYDWADASGGFYYTMPIGPGAGVDSAVSATKDLFEYYQLEDIPDIWIATSAETRELAEGVHLRMEIVVQSIAVPTYIDTDGKKKNVWWLQAWYDATKIGKLDPNDERNSAYLARKEEYTITYNE
jgi:hypothetical protein